MAERGKKKTYRHLTHEDFGPLYNDKSRVLVLGSFPSVRSREEGFYYGHRQNRFWPLMTRICRPEGPVPETKEEKAAMVLERGIALWDVIDSCDIIGSSDASIRNAAVTDLTLILDAAPVRHIFVNGQTAFRLYRKYTLPLIGDRVSASVLPSTSPANAAWSLERLYGEWKQIQDYLI